jgi:hypothetical protein
LFGSNCKQYAGKKMYGVTELTEWDQINYHVVLEDEKAGHM